MSHRVERVAEALQEAVAEVVQREIKDPRVGMVTITRARVSPDLRHARVYFSVLGDETQRRKSLDGLRSAAGFLRRQVARRLQLRVAPELRFELDENIEYAAEMLQKLNANRPPDGEET